MRKRPTWPIVFGLFSIAYLIVSRTEECRAQIVDDYYDIGGFHQRVSTESAVAQTWFDRGLAMCFAFNHEEAVRCFERALANDPGMTMALWGIAYAEGPNINNMETEPSKIAQARFATHLARLHMNTATEFERDLVVALEKRYVTPVPDDRDPLNRAYADAMREVHRKHSDEPLAAALFAESLMNLQPWAYWSRAGQPAEGTLELVEVLEGALERWPNHPALCHFYIHTMEMSPTPGKALPAANRLRNSMPGAGHLVHMPSHIDVLVGHYEDVIVTNQKAVEADEQFERREGALNFYTYYRVHHYHFLVYGAMFDGQSQLALRTARELVKQVPEAMLKEQTDFLDAFMPTALHAMVRFGQWDEILAEPEPAEYLPVSRCIWHYSRAIAFAAQGQVRKARSEEVAFQQVRATVPESSVLFQNKSRDILTVAAAMLAGEVAYREQDYDRAFQHLREAVRREDALKYDEPWGWMVPTRHALGALLLEQQRIEEAAAVYQADLKRHPANMWALHGLAECLEKQGDADNARRTRERFDAVSKRADVKVDRSCFCRVGVPSGQSQ